MPADGMVRQLRRFAAFRELDTPMVDAFARGGTTRRLEPGETLVRTGDAAGEVFVLLAGSLLVLTEPDDPSAAALDTLTPGAVVGEIAALTGGRRSATLRADGRCEVLAIDGARFAEVVESHPPLAASLTATARQRLTRTRLHQQLTALSGTADPAAVTAAATRAELTELAAGQVLPSAIDRAHLVVSGRLRVLMRDADGDPLAPVPEVGPGELLDPEVLLGAAAPDATVIAARATQVASFELEDLLGLLQRDPTALLALARGVVAHERGAPLPLDRAREERTTIAAVPLQPAAHLQDVVRALAAADAGPTSMLDRAAVEGALGGPGTADATDSAVAELRVERWLDEAEDGTARLLLLADAEDRGWSARCVDRADHVLLVADATQEPHPTAVELALLPPRRFPHQRVTLLLVHPAGTDRPRGTERWLAARDVDDHWHLRLDDPRDLARVGRLLAGRPTWLVLGGGGAKGFAHLGAAQAIEELGLPIDGVVGSSVGAPLAALLAIETPSDELIAVTERLFADVLDYTVPISGLIRARRIVEAIERGVDGRSLEDTWLPIRCVSTNLTRSRVHVHRRGDLVRAIRASLSIPGVMPPVAIGEDLHVDGGVMNNLPIDVARREAPHGVVIASDVAPPLGPRAKGDHGLSVAGGAVLLRRWMPGVASPRVPRLATTLMRSLLAAAAQERDRMLASGLADVCLTYDLRGVGLLAFEEVGDVAERGRTAALGPLRAFLEGQVTSGAR